MKILKTDIETNLLLAKINLQDPSALKIKGYGPLFYYCGCGDAHDINDNNIVKFTYTKAFPVGLGEISFNYRTAGEIETTFEYAFSQLLVELL